MAIGGKEDQAAQSRHRASTTGAENAGSLKARTGGPLLELQKRHRGAMRTQSHDERIARIAEELGAPPACSEASLP